MSQATFDNVLKQVELLSITEQMELIARVAQQLKNQLPFNKPTKAQELLEKTHGIWQLEDGLEYQQKLRAEWDK
jgi:hypothetical protein